MRLPKFFFAEYIDTKASAAEIASRLAFQQKLQTFDKPSEQG
jgi:hypothetical protein